MTKTTKLIMSANIAQVDALWAILKYHKLGIKKKLEAMSTVLGIDPSEIIDEAPQEENGRILSTETRYVIHGPLLERSKELNDY